MKIENEYTKKAHIIRFRDGDTLIAFIECEHCRGLHREVIRLPHIDSYEPIGADSARAKSIAETLTKEYRGRVGFVVPNQVRRDRYGRLIADVLLDGELLSNLLVKSGMSWYGVGRPGPKIQ